MKVCLRSALYPAILPGRRRRAVHPGAHPAPWLLRVQLHPLRPGLPDRRHPRPPSGEKKREVIGKAVFDKNHCIPFARRIDCIVCEEHCPIPQKAIRSEIVTLTGFDGRLSG